MNGPSETVAAAAADIRAALDSGELWPLGVLRARELDPDSPHSHEPGAAVLAAPRRPDTAAALAAWLRAVAAALDETDRP